MAGNRNGNGNEKHIRGRVDAVVVVVGTGIVCWISMGGWAVEYCIRRPPGHGTMG